jgi:ferric-dicitrate binding protein FerR (iron transport regulator)
MTDETWWVLACKVWGQNASPEETAQFNVWAAQKANAPLLAEYRRLWDLTAPVSIADFRAGESWNELEQRLAIPGEPARNVRVLPLWVKVAASVLLLAAVLFYVPGRFREKLITIQTANNQRMVVLPDSSHVWLNANSSLSYEEVFTGSRRKVILDGEAFFEITKDAAKPFIIESAGTETKVLGTSFNVLASEGAPVTVTVVTGKVQFGPLADEAMRVTLLPGDAGTFDAAVSRLERHINEDPYFLLWHNQTLSFNKTPLAQVFQSLEKVYSVHITSASKVPPSCTFTGTFEKAALPEIMEVLKTSVGFDVSEKNTHYTITNLYCQ